MRHTNRYNLFEPDDNDLFNIAYENANMDIIEEALNNHKHDDRYAKLNHNHDNIYYTKSEINDVVSQQIADIIDDAPKEFDTLKEIADWIKGDESVTTQIINDISDLKTNKADVNHTHNDIYYTKSNIDTKLDDKVNVVVGKGLSTEDFTTTEKSKLNGIDYGANKTIIDNSLSDVSTNPLQNKVVTQALNNKVSVVNGKGLSTEDYSTEDKTKLGNIEDGANKTIVDSVMSNISTNPVQNKTVNSALGAKADKATTLSGYGITDAISVSEAEEIDIDFSNYFT